MTDATPTYIVQVTHALIHDQKGELMMKCRLVTALGLSMRLNIANDRLAVPACTYACWDACHCLVLGFLQVIK